jgi:hypothetical protein
MNDKRLPPVPLTEALLWKIEEFCALHRISLSKFYELQRDGLGPELIYVGNSPRISREAAADWRNRMRGPKAAADGGA